MVIQNTSEKHLNIRESEWSFMASSLPTNKELYPVEEKGENT
jgi:hypothetical protein